jgi:DnaJ-class molecular chaperone
MYHPDRVEGLGIELRELAERKAKEVNNAYATAKQQRRFKWSLRSFAAAMFVQSHANMSPTAQSPVTYEPPMVAFAAARAFGHACGNLSVRMTGTGGNDMMQASMTQAPLWSAILGS